MKKIFFSILAMAAMAACATDEPIALNQEAIQFGNPFVDNSVRATDYSKQLIASFLVYGAIVGKENGANVDLNLYDGETVSRSNKGYGDVWDCSGTAQYWINGANYKFAAVVGVDETAVDTGNGGLPVSIAYDASTQSDVLYNYVEKQGKPQGQNSTVGFTFTHLLAKAFFTVSNGTNDQNYSYTISNVKVTNGYSEAVYKVTGDTGAWDDEVVDTTCATTSFANVEDVKYNAPKTNAEVLLIPGATIGVSFDVTIKYNGTEIVTYNFEKSAVATLAANKVYNLNIQFTALDQINFTVTNVNTWETPNSDVSVPVPTPSN